MAAVDDDGTRGKCTVASRSGSDARRSGWIARRDVGAIVGIDHLVGRSKRGSEVVGVVMDP